MSPEDLVGLPTNHRRIREFVERGLGRVTQEGTLEVNARPRANRFERLLERHWGHASFRAQTWAFTREWGFTCECEDCEMEARVPITELRHMEWSRNVLIRRVGIDGSKGRKLRRRAERRALVKAKALLHRNLTREQRWDLRATKSFRIVGKDGKHYRITEGSSSNVQLLLEDGTPTHTLCVIFKDRGMPVYDLMLAQKLILEDSPEAFWKLAVVRPLTPLEPASNRFLQDDGAWEATTNPQEPLRAIA